MKDQLISFETAKLAEKKGLTIKDCESQSMTYGYITERGHGTINDGYIENVIPIYEEEGEHFYPHCTQSLLQKWLREKYNLSIAIIPESAKTGMEITIAYGVVIYNLAWLSTIIYSTVPDEFESITKWLKNNPKTYEKALEKGLQEALKLIK